MKTGINLKIKNYIAFLTINRPKQRNAIDLKSTDEFLEAVRMIEADDKVHVVILTGSGGVFCAGADLSEYLTCKLFTLERANIRCRMQIPSQRMMKLDNAAKQNTLVMSFVQQNKYVPH